MLAVCLSISVGLGLIDKEYEHQRQAPIGVLQVSHPVTKMISVDYLHASSLRAKDYDYGVNILYIKMVIK